MDAQERSRWVVELARALGFDLCGVAPAEDFEELARLPEWLAKGFAGEMRYLEDPRRQSPLRVLEGARSLIVCALNYNTPLPYSTEVPTTPGTNEDSGPRGPRGWISRYAWGDDYHTVLGEKLEKLLAAMRAGIAQPFEARAYVDTGPLVERLAARYAGLGWLAKNTCLIHPELGSWLFLGVIVTTLDLAPTLGPGEGPAPDLCGNCTLCIDACPTGALVEPYLLDTRRCISYLTIEYRGSIPLEMRGATGRHVFGCDICQDVCPWNRKSRVSTLAAFLPREVPRQPAISENETRNSKLETRNSIGDANHWPPGTGHSSLFAPPLEWLASLSEDEFKRVFRNSAIKRTKWRGLVRNACVALGNAAAGLAPAARQRVTALLTRLAESGDDLIAEHARWALSRLRAL